MGLTGKKRNREPSSNGNLSPGSAHRSLKTGGTVRQNNSPPKQQRKDHALFSQPHAKAGTAVHKWQHKSGSRVPHKVVPQQQAEASHNGRLAAPAISAAQDTLQNSAAADCALPQRKKRNKNKFKPDPDPALLSAPPQQASDECTIEGILPIAADRNAAGVGRPVQESGVSDGTEKKRSKRKSKQKSDNNPAPAQPLNIPAAKQQSMKQSRSSHLLSKKKHQGQGAMPAKTCLNAFSQGQPAASAHQKPEAAGVGALRQGSARAAHAEASNANQEGSPEKRNHRKRHKADGQAQKPKVPETAPALQQGAPGKGNGPSSTAAAKVAVKTVTAPPLPGKSMSANWAALKAQIAPSGSKTRPRKAAEPEGIAKAPEAIAATQGVTPVLAVDCEMVGAGPEGARSLLARVCVVNQAGNVLLDEYVAQKERVTDYRTRFSGIRPSNLVGAPSLEEVQAKVAAMFKGRIVVGHSITNDLTALLLSHPRKLIRDTARFPPLMRAAAPGRRPKPRALRHLAAQHLGLTIQAGEHSPVDDARAALYLYLRFQKEWEHNIERGTVSQLLPPLPGQTGKAKRQRTLEEMAAADTMVDL